LRIGGMVYLRRNVSKMIADTANMSAEDGSGMQRSSWAGVLMGMRSQGIMARRVWVVRQSNPHP